MINDIKIIDNIDILLNTKIVLYGAGYHGTRMLKMLKKADMPASYLCDSDPRKWGTLILGTVVLSPSELKQLDETESLSVVITTDQTHLVDQIAGDIAWLNLRTDDVFTLFGLDYSLERNKRTTKFNSGFYDAVQEMRRDVFCTIEGAKRLNFGIKWAEQPSAVLVYSAPKAGSITLRDSLHEVNIYADHLHELAGLTIYTDPMNEGIIKEYGQDFRSILFSCKSVKIITMVREPVIKNLSLIFELLGHFSLSRHFSFRLADVPHGESFIHSVKEKMVSYTGAPMDSLNWFDKELKDVFDIDVYSYPFDMEKGYSIIKKGNIEALVIKLERLNSLEQIIAEFIGVPRFKLVNRNVSDNKPYKYLYKQILDSIQIPRAIFEYYYNDLRMKHFYSADEISVFLQKWDKNIEISI
jgi:hypothetical protein